MDPGEKFICLFSGGKDCGLAFSMASKIGIPVALVTCFKEGRARFHCHGRDIIDLQASRMGIDVEYVNGHWKNLEKMGPIYRKYAQMGVTTVVFGDLYDVTNANIKIRHCIECGMKPCMPLFGKGFYETMDEYERHNLRCIITMARLKWLSDDIVGAEFSRETFQELIKKGLDPMGENGEYHTTLIDADVFDRPIKCEIHGIEHAEDKWGTKAFLRFSGK